MPNLVALYQMGCYIIFGSEVSGHCWGLGRFNNWN